MCDTAADDVIRDGAERRLDAAVDFCLQFVLPGLAAPGFRVVEEVLLGSIVVAAAGLPVAAAYVVG